MNVKKLFRQHLFVFLIGLALIAAGCGGGSSSYDEFKPLQTEPIQGQTENVLINAEILKGWIDAGLVNNDSSENKVVILEVTGSDENFAQNGHIPGAQCWLTGNHVMNRVEGPIEAVNMVLDGPSMDELLQQHGIDERTTIVITAPADSRSFFPGRTYFLLRYWGFPKERLKVLNGFNQAWADAGYTFELGSGPQINRSDYSVKDLPQFRPDLRASLSEVIAAVENATALPVDFRSSSAPTGPSTGGVFEDDHGSDYTVFDGTMVGGEYFSWANFTNNVNGTGTGYFVDKAVLEAQLPFDNSEKIISMCRTGYIASAGFFVLDGILNWDVMTYDGSWSQWGQLSTLDEKDGILPAAYSDWRTDIPELMENIIYNKDEGVLIEPARIEVPTALGPYDAGANNIEDEDRAYRNAPKETTEDGSNSTSGSNSGGC